jgi:hypothetical protein
MAKIQRAEGMFKLLDPLGKGSVSAFDAVHAINTVLAPNDVLKVVAEEVLKGCEFHYGGNGEEVCAIIRMAMAKFKFKRDPELPYPTYDPEDTE